MVTTRPRGVKHLVGQSPTASGALRPANRLVAAARKIQENSDKAGLLLANILNSTRPAAADNPLLVSLDVVLA